MDLIDIDQDCRYVVLENHTDQGIHAAICHSKWIRIPLAIVSWLNTARASSLPPTSARELYLETFVWT